MSATTPFDAAGRALASAAAITETQARGTLRLILGERRVVVRLARRDDIVAALGDLAAALARRHLRADAAVIDAVRQAVQGATDPRDDGFDLFRDIDE